MHRLLLNRVCCFLNFSCSACVTEGAGPLKSRGSYLHDGSSTERDVLKHISLASFSLNCVCVAQQISIKRANIAHTLVCPSIPVNMGEEEVAALIVDKRQWHVQCWFCW